MKPHRSAYDTRYALVTEKKAAGETYTPKNLADFVAEKIVEVFEAYPIERPLRVIDPAVGDGNLLLSLLEILYKRSNIDIEIYGFDLNQNALDIAKSRVSRLFPKLLVNFKAEDFLEYVLRNFGVETNSNLNLFKPSSPEAYDLIIANPPYVRTQILGVEHTQLIAKQFGLNGRVDLYHAFIVAMAQVLKPRGIAGIIVSNRFLTTRSGTSVRKALRQNFHLRHIWDLGDTKLFDAAVLPAVLLVEGKNGYNLGIPKFTSIYETGKEPSMNAFSPIEALSLTGVVKIRDGRQFLVQHGKLKMSEMSEDVWRISTEKAEAWLDTVEKNTWGTFGDIGKIRVGVKTCADNIFIRTDWSDLPVEEQPELLRPLITHHIARRFKAFTSEQTRQILYPHETVGGRRRTVNLFHYPCSKVYLERNRANLEARKYVIESGRKWYEIWVPQDPSAWSQTKLVFRDISEEPTFWIDQEGCVVNGDCYWLICENPTQTDLLWLAVAVGNSTFIERFYDYCFHNKLYARRRRFITQYVEKFPIPDPFSTIGKKITTMAKDIYECIPSAGAEALQVELNLMVWESFGLTVEEIAW